MYSSSITSPRPSDHSYVKMPGITGTSASRLPSYKMTYNSYRNTNTTTSALKTPPMQRTTYGATSSNYSPLSRVRPLPSGPGPLAPDGRNKLPSDFTVKSRIRAPSLTRNGPVRVDCNSDCTRSYLNYQSASQKGSSSSNFSQSSLHGRRSGSLLNLSSLNSDYDRNDRFDHLNNNSTTAKATYDYGSHSRSSSRSRIYADYSDTDTSTKPYGSNRYGVQRRSSIATKDEYTRGSTFERSPEPRVTVTATYKSDYPSSVRRSSVRENGIVPTNRRFHEKDDGSYTEQNLNNNLSQLSLSNRHTRGKIGLRNLGNTCFMNSILQSLSNTKPLLEYCLNDEFRSELTSSSSNVKGALFIGYAGLMKSLWNEGSDSYVSPNNFKTQIQRFAPRFMGYQQQDAQEFLRYVLEGLHEDVNRVTTKQKHTVPDEEEEDRLSDSEKAKEYWRRYLTVDNSKIVDIFVGQLKSELKFDACGHKSVTFDPFWDLSVPIPKGKSCVTLQDCISLFMKEEELDDEERPSCSKCKERRSCKKAFSIQKFPKILVLHLKRFSQEMYRRKLTGLVEFPVTGLDLTAFSAETGGPKILYNLYAVCNHSGGTHSGHYTAHCKHPYADEWNYFNDSRVTLSNGQNAVSAEAYVLFYELSSQSARL
ncbi:ubiquitin carboxyl-terminal hydrolase 2-like [Liolophura sinensis]|uniref:ubiquitin carboxyl-terminal hydrolase 2-like n=1 Tax=Liolophura sinensis TaxID=3198878 RepID=UPI003158CA29